MTQEKPDWLTVAMLYAAAFMQGLAMVSFAASGTILKDIKNFTDAQYGLIFLPQIITTIFGSVAGGGLARKMGLRRLLVGALIATALSQVGLGMAVEIVPSGPAFYLVLCSTAMFGLAFGIGAAPLNTYPGLLFPNKKDTALVALHTILGIGLSLGPLLVGSLTNAGFWVGYPLLLTAFGVLLLIALPWSNPPDYQSATEKAELDREASDDTLRERPMVSPLLWTFVVIAILYAFAEGTFANWCIIYLNEERGIVLTKASLALSVFWALLAGGRLIVSALLLRIRAEWIWLTLPILMVISFLLLPAVRSAYTGILLFGLAGLSCSAFFPLTVGLVSKHFPANAAMASSLMIAALMFGVGIGSFVIGPLRSALPLERLYNYSALYPLGVFALAVLIVAGQSKKEYLKDKTCRLIFGRPC